LQTYAQLFLASGHYSDLGQVVVSKAGLPISLSYLAANAGAPTSATHAADFEEAALNVNVVLRWEYHLGSTLFLVYSRSQIPNVELMTNDATLRPSAVLRGSAVDVFLVKLSYWWAS
jgi:hypothetical protein